MKLPFSLLVARHALVWTAALLACACQGPPSSPMTFSATEISAPVGVDSGEPFLSSSGDTVLMSWIGRSSSGVRQVSFATYVAGAWSAPRTIVESERLLVNVADFPSVVSAPDGTLWTHWLERDVEGFGYGVRIASSTDDGTTWSAPWTPHADVPGTDHGFVSMVPDVGGMGFVWLDGRAFAAAPDGSSPTGETALYYRAGDGGGPVDDEEALDLRVCDCCQTDAAVTSRGPLLVYRDRSPDEIRDIRVAHFLDGAWQAGDLVHEDDWETGACPINGPAVAADGEVVAVAWFTAAGQEPRVNVAFSDDGGRRFDDPVRVDEGLPAGRVDVVLLADGSAVVSWVERTGGEGADVRLRRVDSRGRLLETVSASGPSGGRPIGFPRLARTGDGAIIVAWMDGTEIIPRVRVTRVDVEDS